MPTLLFADADRELREIYPSLLSHKGFVVETAGDGLECLAKLRQFMPDLLILDLELPWGGGDGVLGVMREDPRLQAVRVVLTSTAAGNLDSVTSPPVVLTLPKPFPLSALLLCAENKRQTIIDSLVS